MPVGLQIFGVNGELEYDSSSFKRYAKVLGSFLATKPHNGSYITQASSFNGHGYGQFVDSRLASIPFDDVFIFSGGAMPEKEYSLGETDFYIDIVRHRSLQSSIFYKIYWKNPVRIYFGVF